MRGPQRDCDGRVRARERDVAAQPIGYAAEQLRAVEGDVEVFEVYRVTSAVASPRAILRMASRSPWSAMQPLARAASMSARPRRACQRRSARRRGPRPSAVAATACRRPGAQAGSRDGADRVFAEGDD
jgi:hypothetical protein